MAEQEIWIFDEFDKGINSSSNSKDIESSEFLEMNDCNISQTGIIKVIGKALEDETTVTPWRVNGSLIPGYGFYDFFSDYTFSPGIEGGVTLTHGVEATAQNGAKAYIEIYPMYHNSFGWYFDVQPTAGELKAVIKVNDVAIHGQLNGSGTHLTFLHHGSDWSSIQETVSTATHSGAPINILTAKSAYSEDFSEERWNPDSVDDEEDYFLPYTNEQASWPSTAYNGWEMLDTFVIDDADNLSYFMPNIPDPIDLANIHWQPVFWDNSPSPGTATNDTWYKFNDNRFMFGLSTNNTGMYMIGYNDFAGYNHNEIPWLWSSNNWSDYIPGYSASLGDGKFNLPSRMNEFTDEDSNLHLKNGIWRSFIQAINEFDGSDATNQFTATWVRADNDLANHYHDNLDDSIIIKAADGGAALNGARLKIDFTAASLNNSANLINSYTPAKVDTGENTTAAMSSSINYFVAERIAARKFKIGEMVFIEDEYMLIWKIVPLVSEQKTQFYVERPTGITHWIYKHYGGAIQNSHSSGEDIYKFKIHTPRLDRAYNYPEVYSQAVIKNDAWQRQLGNGFSWQGDHVFHGGTASTSAAQSVTFSGAESSGDRVYLKIVPTDSSSSISEGTLHFVCGGSHNQSAADAAEKLSLFSGITGTSDGAKAIATSSVGGSTENFHLITWTEASTTINPAQGVNEEFSVLISETDIHPNQFVDEYIPEWYLYETTYGNMLDIDEAWGPKYTEFEVFSKYQGNWQATLERFRLKWIYLDTLGEKNKPLMWDEGSRLRICDANFNLKWNKNRVFSFFDLTKYFKNDDLNEANWSGWTTVGDSSLDKRLFRMTNGEKVWEYTCGVISNSGNIGTEIEDTDGNDTLNGGLWQATLPGFNNEEHYDDKPAMRLHFDKSAAAEGGIDWQGTCKFYAAAVYDDEGDGLPSHQFTIGDTEAANIGNYTLTFGNTTVDDDDYGEPTGEVLRIFTGFKPMLDGQLAFPDLRITGIRLYYTHSDEGFETYWSLGVIDFRHGFLKTNEVLNVDQMYSNTERIVWTGPVDDLASEGGADGNGTSDNVLLLYNPATTKHYVEFISMPKTETFESINGYSPNNETLSVRYKTHCIGGRRSFVGNISVKDSNGDLKFYNDRMVVSPVNQLDTFPYPSNVLDLDISDGDEIIALQTLGDKILQFKKNMLYVLNIASGIPSEFFVEERHKFKGALNSNHIVETREGIFWVNEFGAFLFTGEEIEDLHMKEDNDKSQRRISQDDWSDFVSSDSSVGYNPESKEVFVVKNSSHSVPSDGDCYIYNFTVKAWTFGKNRFYCGANKTITNMQNVGDSAVLGFIYDGFIGESPDDSGGIP